MSNHLTKQEAELIAEELEDAIKEYKDQIDMYGSSVLESGGEFDRDWYDKRIEAIEVARQKMLNYNEINTIFHADEKRKFEILYACIFLILALLAAYYFLIMENTKG